MPLVFQQASVIRANCDVNLEEICGEMEVDAWSEKRWKLIFEENDVCVMTAQIFLDTLHHGFISLEKVGGGVNGLGTHTHAILKGILNAIPDRRTS